MSHEFSLRAPGLAGKLQRSAAGLARDAVAAFTEDGGAPRAIGYAGMAVEHLVKSYLAAIDPVLLVEERGADLDTLLHLSGHGSRATKPMAQIRTVSAEGACLRVSRLSGKFTFGERERALFVARNASVHLAGGDAETARVAVQTMVSMVMQLLDLLDIKQVAFWSTSTDTARMLYDESVEAVRITVAAKIHAARGRINRHIERLPDELRPVVMETMAGDLPPIYLGVMIEQTCPACGLRGWVLHEVEDTPGEPAVIDRVQFDEEYVEETGFVHQTAYPIGFECRACGLSLEGTDELEAGGVDTDGFDHGTRVIEPYGDDVRHFQ